MKNKLIDQLNHYKTFNEQEENDKAIILHMLKECPDIFSRENKLAHITVSGWVVNKERTKTIMAYHKIYNSWAWLGGHADGNENLSEVAIKEVKEECGAENAKLISDEIFSIEILTVSGHEKHGKYVPSHLHLNFTYLIEVDEADKLRAKADENTNVNWFVFEDAVNVSSEEWFKQRIYSKLIEKSKKS